jgi:hypothetical protein
MHFLLPFSPFFSTPRLSSFPRSHIPSSSSSLKCSRRRNESEADVFRLRIEKLETTPSVLFLPVVTPRPLLQLFLAFGELVAALQQ